MVEGTVVIRGYGPKSETSDRLKMLAEADIR